MEGKKSEIKGCWARVSKVGRTVRCRCRQILRPKILRIVKTVLRGLVVLSWQLLVGPPGLEPGTVRL